MDNERLYECEREGCDVTTYHPVRMNHGFYCSDECAKVAHPNGSWFDED